MTPEHSEILSHLYETYYIFLVRYAHSILADWDTVEDIVQRVFEIACAKENTLDAIANRKAWLIDTLKLEIKNYRRTAGIRDRYAANFEPDAEYESPDSSLQFDNADYIKPPNVSAEDFEIVKHMAIYGRSCDHTAKLMGISKSACYKRYQRAKKKIKKYYENLK